MGFLGEIDALTNLIGKLKRFFGITNGIEKSCEDYYYDEYNKKIFVKKNGDGLIVSSCTLRVVDPIKTEFLIRTLDIDDAKRSTHFESLEKCLLLL